MKCEVCHGEVKELRRGRCWGCYSKWADRRPVGIGAKCITCGDRRRAVLKRVEILGAWMPMCFNCCGRVGDLPRIPQTLRSLRQSITRERRDRERRYGKDDDRVFQRERRIFDRRFGRDEDFLAVDDDMVFDMVLLEPEVQDRADLTMIARIPEESKAVNE